MEYIIFLSKLDKEILDLLIKANYIVEENKIECLLNKEIDDLFKELNSDAIKFQELYYLERKHINFLDKQRCGNFITS